MSDNTFTKVVYTNNNSEKRNWKPRNNDSRKRNWKPRNNDSGKRNWKPRNNDSEKIIKEKKIPNEPIWIPKPSPEGTWASVVRNNIEKEFLDM